MVYRSIQEIHFIFIYKIKLIYKNDVLNRKISVAKINIIDFSSAPSVKHSHIFYKSWKKETGSIKSGLFLRAWLVLLLLNRLIKLPLNFINRDTIL